MKKVLLLSSVLMIISNLALADDAIRIVGSSTVYPFSTKVAEQFGKTTEFPTPIVESTGTGGGIKLFCSGVGLDTPSVVNASRKIKDSEIETCKKNGITDILEVRIGFDGIVLANSKQSNQFNLTVDQLFKALAKNVPIDGQLVVNPYTTWNQIDSSLPNQKIEVMGPPTTSGTRDAFIELVMDKACAKIDEIKNISDEKERKEACASIREDGTWIDSGENDNLVIQKIEANPNAIGIFGYSFLEENKDKIQGAFMDGIEPTFETISDSSYELSRMLYFYVKKDHIGKVSGLTNFVKEFESDKASSEDGYLSDIGLIPLPEDMHQQEKAKLSEF